MWVCIERLFVFVCKSTTPCPGSNLTRKKFTHNSPSSTYTYGQTLRLWKVVMKLGRRRHTKDFTLAKEWFTTTENKMNFTWTPCRSVSRDSEVHFCLVLREKQAWSYCNFAPQPTAVYKVHIFTAPIQNFHTRILQLQWPHTAPSLILTSPEPQPTLVAQLPKSLNELTPSLSSPFVSAFTCSTNLVLTVT